LPPLAAVAQRAPRPSNMDAMAGRKNGTRVAFDPRVQHIDGEESKGAQEKESSTKSTTEPGLVDRASAWISNNQTAAIVFAVIGASILFKRRSVIQQSL
jgi:hypothetical protein